MRMYDIIQKKRDGGKLTKEEIKFFVDGYTKGEIPDYQASALCMAIYYRKMSDRETAYLTDAMANSGDTLDLSCFGALSADKHSTGGVGDKTSLIVGPVVASLGVKLAKMSGRGLGHTGGTVDKLESISGYKTALSTDEFIDQVKKCGIAVIGQTADLAPADKKLYALRDVTATVDSIPLITSSIMSKKLAAGSRNIVLDVKVGSGAFMKTPRDARLLAKKMVTIGKKCRRNVRAVLTDMNVPLGNAVGNALEIKEAIAVLRDGKRGDLYDVCIALATQIVSLTFKLDEKSAREKVMGAVSDGSAFAKMREWIAAQGGDVSQIDHPEKLPTAKYEYKVVSEKDGYIEKMDTEKIGISAVLLGAGRKAKEDPIDHAAGIIIEKKTGDRVKCGDVLCTLFANDKSLFLSAREEYLSAIKFGEHSFEKQPVIYGIIK
ncbi:MAG: pyrimidine-nucleoside phosphorylase [Clostridia bacterium]|nr:pyrimidine-nucleoside phosphorylase [Clostridia bacterium]